jgi:Domain of unknown function (DUF4304)
MASDQNKLLQAALSQCLKERGFRKTGPTWRSDSTDCVSVLNIQGSQWGPSFYINLGVYFRALGTEPNPNEYDCHIRCRLADLLPQRERLAQILDFEKEVSLSVRSRELEAAVIQYALPWLERCSSRSGAATFVASLPARSPWVTEAVRTFLKVPSV